MSIPFSNTNYRIPRGFANLLEGLTREVLREQPQDIPLFAAQYFAALLKNRKETGFDPVEVGAKLEDRFYNNHSFQHVEEDLLSSRSEDVSGISERDSNIDRSMKFPQPPEALSSIQQSEVEDQTTEQSNAVLQPDEVAEKEESTPIPDSSEDAPEPDAPSSAQLSEAEHKEEGQDEQVQDQAATLIQAAIRGHLARQEVKKSREVDK